MVRYLRRSIPVIATVLAVLATSRANADEIYSAGGVAINGYDSVAYFTERKPVKGTKDFTASYKGSTFQFATSSNRDTFARDPDRYAPQYGGYCAYGLARGYKATTEPQAFTIVDDKLYLNYDDQVMQTWRGDVSAYIDKADTNWKSVRTQAFP